MLTLLLSYIRHTLLQPHRSQSEVTLDPKLISVAITVTHLSVVRIADAANQKFELILRGNARHFDFWNVVGEEELAFLRNDFRVQGSPDIDKSRIQFVPMSS